MGEEIVWKGLHLIFLMTVGIVISHSLDYYKVPPIDNLVRAWFFFILHLFVR